ncbi:MAG TPA: hypothetical protein VMV24_01910 [Candidatus Dormibacteraeota bacterium]|nr:hypothetical protein [Candidatus Dormibacteraeota bacterium]
MTTEFLPSIIPDEEAPKVEGHRLFIPDKLLIVPSLMPFLAQDQINESFDLSNRRSVEEYNSRKNRQIDDTFDNIVKVRAFHFLEEWSFLVRDADQFLTCSTNNVLTKLFGSLNDIASFADINNLNNLGLKIEVPILGKPDTVKDALYYHETNRFDIADLYQRVYPIFETDNN